MPWKGVTVSEQRGDFLRDYHLRYYSLTELAERYSVRGRRPTSGSVATNSWGGRGWKTCRVARWAARGRRRGTSSRHWWGSGRNIRVGGQTSCWMCWRGITLDGSCPPHPRRRESRATTGWCGYDAVIGGPIRAARSMWQGNRTRSGG